MRPSCGRRFSATSMRPSILIRLVIAAFTASASRRRGAARRRCESGSLAPCLAARLDVDVAGALVERVLQQPVDDVARCARRWRPAAGPVRPELDQLLEVQPPGERLRIQSAAIAGVAQVRTPQTEEGVLGRLPPVEPPADPVHLVVGHEAVLVQPLEEQSPVEALAREVDLDHDVGTICTTCTCASGKI
jgi:hypothetical protein